MTSKSSSQANSNGRSVQLQDPNHNHPTRSSTSTLKGMKISVSTYKNNNAIGSSKSGNGFGSTSTTSTSGSSKQVLTTVKTTPNPQKPSVTSNSRTATAPPPKPPHRTDSSSSVKSSGSSKSGGKSPPSPAKKPGGSPVTYAPKNENKSQSKVGGGGITTTTTSNLGNSAGTIQIQQKQQQFRLPLPTPIVQQRNLSNVFRSAIHLELSRNFRNYVERAMTQHKIFSGNGIYPAIRSALKNRGWIEKPGPLVYSHSFRSTNDVIANTKQYENENDTAWMTRVLKDYPANFIWVNQRHNINWKYLTKDQMINRFPTAWFTTKTGLCASLQNMHWFSEAGISDTFFPRCYRLALEEERQAFQDDYRLTACMSYLRYFVLTFQRKGPGGLADIHSKITPLSIDFACRQLGTYIRTRRHEDIDWLLTPNFMTQHWDAFIQQYYAVVHDNKKMRFDGPDSVQTKYDLAKKTLRKIAQFWPQHLLDGVLNIWICKPAARSCGSGIIIKNKLDDIMNLINHNNIRESNWVVQKYIERPLLIYKTKFDIRQWFLVTDWAPLTVWFYKESYVRFCTKPFALDNFHESIHLCNNAIQCHYQNAPNRDRNLPEDNMWSSEKFQGYLKSINRAEVWEVIYSGMKQAIVGVLLASQESVDTRKRAYSCHELFGADFMLTEDFKPWLIEINDRPAMDPTTRVTTRLCSQVLEDSIKVVVDRRNNRKADTGAFELIYRQNAGSVPGHEFSGHEITITGKRLTRDLDWPMTMSLTPQQLKSKTNTHSQSVAQGLNGPNANGSTMKVPSVTTTRHTLSEHIQKLRMQNQEIYQNVKESSESK